jgi:DNA-binding NtrC family response regulator
MVDNNPTERLVRTSAHLPERLASLRVTVSKPGHETTQVVVSKPRVLLGRAETADVRLDDATVSQFHVELSPTEDGIRVIDLDSSNGVFIGGVQIERAIVPPGSSLLIGATVVTVELAASFALTQSDARSFGPLVGESPVMRQLYAVLERLARTELSVLINGETGTGKELAARALHAAGARCDKPFVVLDCTTVPNNLAASTLFGHEKGAFTGANERRIGVIEAAHGGVLFIDEVGELPIDIQPMLLRVLQQREIVPVGSTRPKSVNIRVISATWRDLRAMVNQGSFREDLYYRLAQVAVSMPSLRERSEDIALLARYFLAKIPGDLPAARDITTGALSALLARPYPGNIRELHSTVERLAMLAAGPAISEADFAFERMLVTARDHADRPPLPPSAVSSGERAVSDPVEPFKSAKRTCIDEFEKSYLVMLLERTSNNISQAAAIAGLERHSLRELLRKHGLYQAKD